MRLPRQLTVLTTSQCTARCDHCSVNSGPERRDRLKFDDMKRVIDQLNQINKLDLVVFAGGEPTLLGEALLDAIAHVTQLGSSTRLITNASWAPTQEKARNKAVKLREAGLREMNISADDYHLPFIPFSNVINAFQACQGLGFGAVVIGNSHMPGDKINPDFIQKELGINLPVTYDDDFTRLVEVDTQPSADGTIYLIHNPKVQLLGRAKQNVDPSSLPMLSLQQLRGGCPYAISHAALSPKGHLVSCCGTEAEGNRVLDFGYAGDCNSVITQANKEILIRGISILGPARLLEIAKKIRPQMSIPQSFCSVCETCEHLTQSSEIVDCLSENKEAIEAEIFMSFLEVVSDKNQRVEFEYS